MTSVHSENLPELTEVHLGINGLVLPCQKGAMQGGKDKEEEYRKKDVLAVPQFFQPWKGEEIDSLFWLSIVG